MFKTKFNAASSSFNADFEVLKLLRGEDGFSPDIDVVKTDEGYNIIVTDKDEQFSFTIKDGRDGTDGKDGYTPVKGKDYFDGTPGKDGIDGKDGYTPIKGVDYFDGRDGHTPVKDVDYFDGKDGYTPVKGVDYFDGKDGADGTPGKSAYSYAKDGGYSGTEEEFAEKLAGEADTINAIPVPTSAAVGQTIVVKTVDENGTPTEWGLIDAPYSKAEIDNILGSYITDIDALIGGDD